MKQFATAIMLTTLGAMAADVPEPAVPYISGQISTKENFKYGRFVTKMQGCDKKGTLASFLTLWLGDEEEKFSVAGWNHINLELVPHQKNKVNTNLIWANFTNEWEAVKNFDPSNNWHFYDIRWTPESIVFLIDGEEVRREEHTDDDFNEALDDLDKRQHLIMSFWTPGWAADHLEDDSSMPWYTRYEYVEVYDYKGLNVETGEDEFELRFRDDFDGDSIDTDRWNFGRHINEGSSTQFVKENAYAEEGMLVLKMEKIGGSDPDKKKTDEDWQVLPAPEPDSLDAAIEKTVRVGVNMVRTYLDDFSYNMSHHLI